MCIISPFSKNLISGILTKILHLMWLNKPMEKKKEIKERRWEKIVRWPNRNSTYKTTDEFHNFAVFDLFHKLFMLVSYHNLCKFIQVWNLVQGKRNAWIRSYGMHVQALLYLCLLLEVVWCTSPRVTVNRFELKVSNMLVFWTKTFAVITTF